MYYEKQYYRRNGRVGKKTNRLNILYYNVPTRGAWGEAEFKRNIEGEERYYYYSHLERPLLANNTK